MKKNASFSLVILSLSLIACREKAMPVKDATVAPISIEGLRQRSYESTLIFEKQLVGTDEYEATLMSYQSDSLKIYTLLNTPKTEPPKTGFPILIFGHGFHPEPKKYGVSNQTGKDWRPGDYYRGTPEAYAEKGFLVITPDYRGHNTSEGFEYTQKGFLAANFYTIDVLNLIAALPDLKQVDLSKIYYMGHSMGGDVGLRMLVATDKIKAASLWSPVVANTWEQALYYGKYYDKDNEKVSPEIMQKYIADLQKNLNELGFDYEVKDGDPIHFTKDLEVPLIIHHARGDKSVPYIWSESLVAKLFQHKKIFEFYTYETDNHLFENENKTKAVERDIEFFSTATSTSNAN